MRRPSTLRRRRRKSAQGLRHRPRDGRDGCCRLLQGHQRHAGQGGRERAGRGPRRRRQARRGLDVPLDPVTRTVLTSACVTRTVNGTGHPRSPTG